MRRDLARRLEALEQDVGGAMMSYVVGMPADIAGDDQAREAAITAAIGKPPRPQDMVIVLERLCSGQPAALVDSWAGRVKRH